MQAEPTNLVGIIPKYEAALVAKELGYSARLKSISSAGQLVRFHELPNTIYYDREITAEYIRNFEQRHYDGKCGLERVTNLRREIGRFVIFLETGTINRDNPMKGAKVTLLLYFQQVTDEYLGSGDFHPNTRNDMRWIAHRYFDWLAKSGYENLHGIGAEQIQQFLLSSSKELSVNSMHNVLLHMRKLYAYLYSAGLAESPYQEMSAFRVNREEKIYPPLPQEAVAKLIASINRNTKSGKRAYAVMLLVAVLGLRACDVVNLKLTDIDWANGEIKIRQSKTSNTVVVPLTTDIGTALSDYILNVRPKSDSKQVFFCLNPNTPIKSAVTIGEIYRDCCKSAGLPVNKRFHTLRRSLGTSLINSGVSVLTAAQVFGDVNYDSMKQYIAVDTEHLKLCALSFDGIAPVKGGDAK